MKKLYFFLSLIGMFTLSVGLAQQKSVSGTILDETGGPLPGATVLVDGTNRERFPEKLNYGDISQMSNKININYNLQ